MRVLVKNDRREDFSAHQDIWKDFSAHNNRH